MLLRAPCLACNRLVGEPLCDLCARLEHAETRSRRRHERRVTELEAAPTFTNAPYGDVYAQELADTREAERLKRERRP